MRGRSRRYGRPLPQLDLVAFGIDEPAESTVLILCDLADLLCTASLNLSERFVKVVDDEIEHVLLIRRIEVGGVVFERCPDSEGAFRH